MNNLLFFRENPPPNGAQIYFYDVGTTNQTQLYSDKNKTVPVVQPIVLGAVSEQVYLENNRVDMKIIDASYPGGFTLLEDQVFWDVDQALYTTSTPEFANLTLTARDTASRPAATAPTVGYNTTTKTFEGYSPDTDSWGSLGGVMDIDQDTYILADDSVEGEDHLRFFTEGAERLTIDHTGNIVMAGTGHLTLPSGASNERPVTPGPGMLRYNSELGQYEGFNNGAWGSLGGVMDVDQDTYILADDSVDLQDHLRFFTEGVERITIDHTGNVGVGTNSPNVQFEVRDMDEAILRVTDGTAEYSFFTQISQANEISTIRTGNTVEQMIIGTNGLAGQGQLELQTGTMQTALLIDNNQNATFSQDLTINGNLTVTGTNSMVDWTTVMAEDNLIVLNSGEIGDGITAGYSGFIIDRGTYNDYQVVYDEATQTLKAGEGIEGDLSALDNVALWNTTPEFTGATLKGLDPILYLQGIGGSSTRLQFTSTKSFTFGDETGTNSITVQNVASGSAMTLNTRDADGADIIFTTRGTEKARISSSGQLLNSDGTSSAPAYSFKSDEDTGMYLDGVDLKLATAGYMRAKFNSSACVFYGDVGIGDATPSHKITAKGDGVDSDPLFKFYSHNGTSDRYLTLTGPADLSDTVSPWVFDTNNAYEFRTDGVPHLVIDGTNAGKVGIGTDTPQHLLSVGPVSSSNDMAINAGPAGTSSLYFYDGSNDGAIQYSHANRAMGFNVAGTSNVLYIDGSANIGAGTDAPAEKLDVNGNTKADSYIMNDTNGDAFASIGVDDVAGTITFSFVPVV